MSKHNKNSLSNKNKETHSKQDVLRKIWRPQNLGPCKKFYIKSGFEITNAGCQQTEANKKEQKTWRHYLFYL